MATKPTQMCVVTLGYRMFLMPLTKGTQMLELIQHAVEVEQVTFEDVRADIYTLKDRPDGGLILVKPSQLRAPDAEMTPAPARRAPKLLK